MVTYKVFGIRIFLSFIRCFKSTRTWIKGAEFGIWYRDFHFVLKPKKANLLKNLSRINIIKNKCYVLFEKRTKLLYNK